MQVVDCKSYVNISSSKRISFKVEFQVPAENVSFSIFRVFSNISFSPLFSNLLIVSLNTLENWLEILTLRLLSCLFFILSCSAMSDFIFEKLLSLYLYVSKTKNINISACCIEKHFFSILFGWSLSTDLLWRFVSNFFFTKSLISREISLTLFG